METNARDYSSISPSAKVLLLLKGRTTIPFAREVASLVATDHSDLPPMDEQTPYFWGRMVHFENRYRSIDQLLEGLPVKNILELSSGFSFRGLDRVLREDCHYIDTDLPEMIAAKKPFLEQLAAGAAYAGRLEMEPLNALDETAFQQVVRHFPEGPVAVVNEGLLMYLGVPEKIKLCSIIRKVLEERGGYWITADIYIKREMEDPNIQVNDPLNRFFEQHRIRENMFDDFEHAAVFFKEQGFVVDKEAETDLSGLSAFQQLKEHVSVDQLAVLKKAQVIQATWRLKLAE